MVEQRSPKPMVGGSNPSAPATFHLDEKHQMNSDQQQLLQLLKIQPYQLHANFSVAALAPAATPAQTDAQHIAATSELTAEVILPITANNAPPGMMLTAASSQSLPDPLLRQLTQDILLLLQTEYPKAQWQAAAQFQHCQWQGDLLQTPELAVLSSSFYKKQLWQQFIQRQDTPDVSEHSSSHTS